MKAQHIDIHGHFLGREASQWKLVGPLNLDIAVGGNRLLKNGKPHELCLLVPIILICPL